MYKLLLHHHMKPPEKSICGIYIFLTSCHLDTRNFSERSCFEVGPYGGSDRSWHMGTFPEVGDTRAACGRCSGDLHFARRSSPLYAHAFWCSPGSSQGRAAVHGTLGAQGGQGPAAAAELSPGRGQHPLGGSAALVFSQQELCPVHVPGRRWPPRQGSHINMEPSRSGCREGQSLSLLTQSSLAISFPTLLKQMDCKARTGAAKSFPP